MDEAQRPVSAAACFTLDILNKWKLKIKRYLQKRHGPGGLLNTFVRRYIDVDFL
jgi:hypothetical protein